MENKKGLTLIEVIVAIALLAIISMLIFPALTNQYIMLRNTRNITFDLYSAQQEIEKVIIDIKNDIQAGVTPDGQSKLTYTLFNGQTAEREVDGYPNRISIHVGNNNLTLNTVIADSRMPLFPVASASNVRLRFYNGSYLDNAYSLTPSLQLVSSFDFSDPENVNLTNINRWYVSREGFNSPMVEDPLEIENGSVFPRFPEDYALIPNNSGVNLTNIQETFAGRHIVYTVTPASQSGKMGVTVPSNPLFISGLPVIGNLALHLDASMLSRESDTVNTLNGHYYVQQWLDISGNNNHAAQSTSNRQPELMNFKTGHKVVNGMTYETYANYLRFDGTRGLTVNNQTSINLDNFTVFVVARSSNTEAGKSVVSKMSDNRGWQLGWTNTDQLGLSIKRYSDTNTISSDPGIALDDEWHILTATTDLSFKVDSLPQIDLSRTVGSITNTNPISIGFNGSNYSTVDIAEIIIYNGTLSEDDEFKVNMYLKDKYNPDSFDINIYALKPITDSAVIGEPYTLPSIIRAYMTNSTMMDVPVTWSENPVDTSTEGLKTSIATAISDLTKTTTAKIDVAGISALNDMSVIVMQHEDYSLPTTVSATLTNGKTTNTLVTWDIDTVDTSAIGIVTRIGTSVIDPSKSMELRIDVVPQSVTDITLNESQITMNINDTYQLIEQIEPTDAYNKTVTWESSVPAVASVSPTGLVTANNSGETIITATTEDGSFSATCTINVRTPVTGVSLDKTAVTSPRSSQFYLTATVEPETADNKTIEWISTNTSVATVNSSGLVTVRSTGNWWNPTPVNGSTTTIRVTTQDGSHSADCIVTVGTPVSGVSLSPGSITLDIGESENLNATVSPSDAYNKSVIWETSNPLVVSVSGSGRIQGVSVGEATITVKTIDGGFIAQSQVNVIDPPLRAVSITGSTSTNSWYRNWFELTFNKQIQSASMSGSSVSISNDEVRFTKSSGGFSTGQYTVTVTDNNQTINVTVELEYSNWNGYRWSIISQG